jgi:Flp pilus assembly protein TadG
MYGKAEISSDSQRGASLVEFAILAPLLLILLFGIVEMSRAMFAYTTVWSAAREGARFATTVEADNYANCNAITTAALSRAVSTNATAANVQIVYKDAIGTTIADCQGGVAPTASNVVSGTTVEVSMVNVTFDSVVPLLEIFLDGLNLESTQSRTIFVGEQVGG